LKIKRINRKPALEFFDSFRGKVKETQIKIAQDCLEELFEASPHAGAPNSTFARSEYDANHKVLINGETVSSHYPATGNAEISKALVDMEKTKLEGTECGDQIVITNTTAHALDVEIGPELTPTRWIRPGYFPYQKTLATIKNRYRNVLK